MTCILQLNIMGFIECFLVSLSFSVTYGLYFHIGETEKKCFIEDIPDDTLVVGEINLNFIYIVFQLN